MAATALACVSYAPVQAQTQSTLNLYGEDDDMGNTIFPHPAIKLEYQYSSGMPFEFERTWNIEHQGPSGILDINYFDGQNKSTLLYFSGWSNRIGVNKTLPDATLDVGGDTKTESLLVTGHTETKSLDVFDAVLGSNHNGVMRIGKTTGNWSFAKYKYLAGSNLRSDAMHISYNDGLVMAITRIGKRVGIGTIEPQEKLDVNGTAKASTFLGPTLNLGLNNSTTTDYWHFQTRNNFGSDVDGTLVLSRNNGIGWSGYVMKIEPVNNGYDMQLNGQLNVQNDGNVGIGTTTPVAKLDVAGYTQTRGLNVFRDGQQLSGFHSDAELNIGRVDNYWHFVQRNNLSGEPGKLILGRMDNSNWLPISALEITPKYDNSNNFEGYHMSVGQKFFFDEDGSFHMDSPDPGNSWTHFNNFGDLDNNPNTPDERANFIRGYTIIGLNGNFIQADGNPQLAVDGEIRAKRVRVLQNGWADYVFEPDYKIATLSETETFIKENKHLPGVPSAEEVAKKGLDVSEMMTIQMEKIEELTLHLIELEKQNQATQQQNKQIQQQIEQIQQQNEALQHRVSS